MKVVATSGYFDPMHIGHVRLLKEARKLGDKLIVILNSDKQAMIKKGFSFMPQEQRKEIIQELNCVDEVFISIDEDGSQCKTLAFLKPDIFAKGGDRNSSNIPETEVCKKYNIEIINNVGGEKIQSSSWLIDKALQRVQEAKENNSK